MNEVEQQPSGWWVPAPGGSVVARYSKAAEETLAAVYPHVRGWEMAVCAGAHVGVWPKLLAERFTKVLAFEPDPVNHACAELNLEDQPTVTLLKHALGDRDALAPWVRSPSNTGKHCVSTASSGDLVRIVTLDSLDLYACDLLCLDVEGYELHALEGANATLADFQPVVLFEDIGHGKKYGVAPGAVQRYLAARGYREVASVYDDRIWAAE